MHKCLMQYIRKMYCLLQIQLQESFCEEQALTLGAICWLYFYLLIMQYFLECSCCFIYNK